MIRFFRALFAWRRIHIAGPVWSYWENGVTGARKAYREQAPVWQPLHMEWLRQGTSWIVVGVEGVQRGKGVTP